MPLQTLTYTNPLFPGYFADPFVFKARGEYWAYGTEMDVPHSDPQKLVFGVLRSPDLVHWTDCGGALEQVAKPLGWSYWAPEVCERDGKFYMFYSTSGSIFRGKLNHHLRLAIADHPAGPFRDTGERLFPQETFSIDAHPFCDPRDGQWYLFFARDDLTHQRVGTGVSVVKLNEQMHFDGEPQWALRPTADWQVFHARRNLYGKRNLKWHTVEGPFVVYRHDRYWMFYSGGAWETPGYGVSFAVADHPLGPWNDEWSADGPQVLMGVPDHVVGPGHNSVVTGPDGVTDFIVYHAWDTAHTARRLCIDPLEWTPRGPRALGPTWTEQEIRIW